MTRRIFSLAVVFVGAVLLGGIAGAQEATPTAESSLELLVVQGFDSGRLTPQDGSADLATLTFEQPMRDALYFSERPNRVVGRYATDELLDILRAAETDPVNAALVADLEGGGEVQVVVELLTGEIDAAGAVSFAVRLLGEADQAGLALEEASLSELTEPIELGRGHLFIDGLGQHKDNPT